MNNSSSSANELLHLALPDVPGLSPRGAGHLQRLGLRTAVDALFYFPRDYYDLTDVRHLRDLEDGADVTVVGTVVDVDVKPLRHRKSLLAVLLDQDGARLRGLWFNQPYMRQKFDLDQQVAFSGKVRLRDERFEISHPIVRWFDPEDAAAGVAGRLLPVYRATEGVYQGQIRHAIRAVLDACADRLDEVFPDSFLDERELWPITRALRELHFPSDKSSLEKARHRFVYQELFVLQLALAVKRLQQQVLAKAPPLELTTKIDARIRRLLPFELTSDQEQAVRDVAADMGRPYPMNRLLQGDVGTGKTVVALFSMLLAVAHGHQAALMAPTEVLARQHAETLDRLLSGSHVRRALLTGTLTPAERKDTLAKLASGDVDLVVGTQAIVQDAVKFSRLGLVVVDEQHKFGVRQRAFIKHAGLAAHYLVMTATPIPRTVTMTLFGDLDVSLIRESPPGRQAIHTYIADQQQRPEWWDFFRRNLDEGRQGYVIVPLIEDASTDDEDAGDENARQIASLESTFESLANGELEAYRLDLVHGRLPPDQKQAAMERFYRGETQVLVATTVVEVGVDVPAATLMTIEDGQRFGLSQLHQLRGRISRGQHAGYCCVFADPNNDDARRRLEAFAETTDGFRLAETDLEIRGPGDLFGTRQHGLPPLRIADLLRDAEVLASARNDAQEFLRADPGLALPDNARLRRMMLNRYGTVLDLADVG